jgi:hypothetical protein
MGEIIVKQSWLIGQFMLLTNFSCQHLKFFPKPQHCKYMRLSVSPVNVSQP